MATTTGTGNASNATPAKLEARRWELDEARAKTLVVRSQGRRLTSVAWSLMAGVDGPRSGRVVFATEREANKPSFGRASLAHVHDLAKQFPLSSLRLVPSCTEVLSGEHGKSPHGQAFIDSIDPGVFEKLSRTGRARRDGRRGSTRPGHSRHLANSQAG